MRVDHLYKAAENNISISMSGSKKQIEASIKKTYGIDNPSNQPLLSDQLFNLIAKAEEDSKVFFKSKVDGKDQVHQSLMQSLGDKEDLKKIHPMDAAFEMIVKAIEFEKNEAQLIKERAGRINLDPINEYAKQYVNNSDQGIKADHTPGEIYNLLDGIFSCRVSSGKETRELDPAQQIVINAFGSGRFPVDPKHTAAEWKELISASLGSRPAPEKSKGIKTELQNSVSDQAITGVNNTKKLQEIFDLVNSTLGEKAFQKFKGIITANVGDGTTEEIAAKLINAYGPKILIDLSSSVVVCEADIKAIKSTTIKNKQKKQNPLTRLGTLFAR
jgi:hypothetical protein